MSFHNISNVRTLFFLMSFLLNSFVFLSLLDSKFSSFLRQLNSYGFRKIVRGEELGCYFHPKFQQHRIDFISMVHRVMGKIELPSFEEVLRATQASSRTSSSSALSRCSSSAKQGLSKSKTSSADFAEIISTESIGGSSLSTDDFSPPKPDANASSFSLRAPWNLYESEQQPSSISPGSLIRAGMVDVKPQISQQDMELEIPSFDVSEEDKRLQLLTVSPDIFRDETEKAAWFLCQSPVLSPPRMSSLHSNIAPFLPAYTQVPQPPPPTAPPAPLSSTSNQKVLFQSYNNYYL